jgi:peptide/nickel transport system substrate-binding protein
VQVKTAGGTRSYEIELNTRSEPFNDVRVRQALNYAINWDPILRDIYHGYAKRLATAFLPNGFGYDPSVKPYPYDPAKARDLLTQAGY